MGCDTTNTRCGLGPAVLGSAAPVPDFFWIRHSLSVRLTSSNEVRRIGRFGLLRRGDWLDPIGRQETNGMPNTMNGYLFTTHLSLHEGWRDHNHLTAFWGEAPSPPKSE